MKKEDESINILGQIKTSNLEWVTRFFKMAMEVSQWSKDQTKVGCIIVSPDKRKFYIGYNGFPKGMYDTRERLDNQDIRNAFVVHAEMNALLSATENIIGWSIYITQFPCSNCAIALVQKGIIEVFCPAPKKNSRWTKSYDNAIKLFDEVGVIINQVDIKV